MASLEAMIPPLLLRAVCARRSLSHRAESALRSSIMACELGGIKFSNGARKQKSSIWPRGERQKKDAKTHGRQVTISRNIITLDGLTSLWVLKEEQALATSQVEMHCYCSS